MQETERPHLLLGIIVCSLVILALCIGAGVAVSGILWYREENTQLVKAKQEMEDKITVLQEKLAQAEEEAEKSGEQAFALQEQLAELQTKLAQQQEELETLKKQAQEKPAAGALAVYPPGAKLVALTFDDGPGPYTERLLDEMKKRDVHATFFVIGQNAAKRPALLKRMTGEGHVIGNHTYTHKQLVEQSDAAMAENLDKCSALIQSITGVSPTLVRAPGGHYNKTVLSLLRDRGMSLADWIVDPQDWKSRDKQTILKDVFKSGQYGLHDGAIVLMHDVYATTVDAAIETMDRLTADGYYMVTVPELLRVRCGGAKPGMVYRSDKIMSTLL